MGATLVVGSSTAVLEVQGEPNSRTKTEHPRWRSRVERECGAYHVEVDARGRRRGLRVALLRYT